MASQFLIDTDVLIDYLRGNTKAKKYFETLSRRVFISTISIAELYAGVRDGPERELLVNFIDRFNIIPTDIKIASIGGLYRRDYCRSHGTGLADALIAATANSVSATLVTLNKKHFPMLRNVLIPYNK